MDSLVPGALHWWAGVSNDQSIADWISDCRKAINVGQKIAEKEPKLYTANLIPHNCTIPEITCVY